MILYFENRYGERTVIAEPNTHEEASIAITRFIDECNARRRAGAKPFVSYYTRSWLNDEGLIVYDVGSHSEFFLLDEKGDINVSENP